MWIVTFADLMALLMCFFVLLLAFSEMDAQKFKQLMGSMKMAFGVQREVEVKQTPKGTSVVMREFSPGQTKKTAINEVRQSTVNDARRHLESGKPDGAGGDGDTHHKSEIAEKREVVDVEKLKEALKEDIEKGLVEVSSDYHRVIVRIKEKSSFASGSAVLISKFQPVMQRIAKVLGDTAGLIIVAGHTDNVPISTARFRSNWELSASRAVSVVHSLQKEGGLDGSRFMIEGHADTVPLADNGTPENRALNRRVEIIILKSGADEDGGYLDLENSQAEPGTVQPAVPAAQGDGAAPTALAEPQAPARG